MDDVDRLFECFKCGISPPHSARGERRTNASRLKQDGTRFEGSETESPRQAGQSKQNTPDIHLKSGRTDKANKVSDARKISPVVFYGSPHGVPPKKPSSLLRLLREIRVDLAEKRRLNLRKEIWATFPRQDEAIKFSKDHANVWVFSYQDHFNGQRRFLVSTYQEFWRRYQNMDPKFRHHYEVIQEGLPCHLYFDLEFNKRENVDKNGDEMVDLLISVVFEALLEKYCIKGEQDWVLELDSSTEEKFSRHLVIRIPQIAFKDNSHTGAFVAEICSRIHSYKEKDKRFEQLFVSKDSNCAAQLFVDTAVYSRNRCFRLALSSKAGKRSMLVPTGRFKCKEMVNYNFRIPFTGLEEFASGPCSGDVASTCVMGKSPFPALDAFIESVASIGDVSGKIRSWYWFSEYGLMVYSMSRNRYCERIGRQHKSNHVIYVADLQWALYYQKCHDPDCRGYRSPSRPIPLEVIPRARPPLGHIECSSLNSDGSLMDVDTNCNWWLEAVKVADSIENVRNLSEFYGQDDTFDDDDEWWMAVERTASQAEKDHPAFVKLETR